MASSEIRDGGLHGGQSSTSLTLLERARQNDKEAWHRLVELYSPLVYDRCRQRLPSGEIADVYQDVFASVLANLHSFQRKRNGSFRKWLETITTNKVNDHFRRLMNEPAGAGGSTAHKHLQEFAEPLDDPSASFDRLSQTEDEALQKNLLRDALKSVLVNFEAKSWQAVVLTVVEDREATETAAMLGMTHGAVRSATSRLRRRVRQELEARIEKLADLDDFCIDQILRLLREVLAEQLLEA